jgi:enoyl-CoA hydratase/carnithine racemase
MNAMTLTTLQELADTVRILIDDSGICVVVITGAGSKAFSAGGDISMLAGLEPCGARELALKLAGKSSVAMKFCKEAVQNGMEMDLPNACRYEADLFALSFTTADQKEGMQAFLEKRKPVFSGQ